MSSPSDSNHQPIITYSLRFPDPTNPEHFTRPPTESLIEEPINPTQSSSGTMSPDHQYTDETEWSIVNPTTTTQDQPEEHSHHQEPAINPAHPAPITAEPVVVPILQSPELKCQDWIDQLPATEDEPDNESIPDDDTRHEVSTTTSLENPPQDDQQQQQQASRQQDSIMDAHEEVGEQEEN